MSTRPNRGAQSRTLYVSTNDSRRAAPNENSAPTMIRRSFPPPVGGSYRRRQDARSTSWTTGSQAPAPTLAQGFASASQRLRIGAPVDPDRRGHPEYLEPFWPVPGAQRSPLRCRPAPTLGRIGPRPRKDFDTSPQLAALVDLREGGRAGSINARRSAVNEIASTAPRPRPRPPDAAGGIPLSATVSLRSRSRHRPRSQRAGR